MRQFDESGPWRDRLQSFKLQSRELWVLRCESLVGREGILHVGLFQHASGASQNQTGWLSECRNLLSIQQYGREHRRQRQSAIDRPHSKALEVRERNKMLNPIGTVRQHDLISTMSDRKAEHLHESKWEFPIIEDPNTVP